jgi:uncharacterized Zn finger protein
MTGRIDLPALTAAAGEKTAARGADYFARDQVELFGADDSGVIGRAFGTEVYRVDLRWRPSPNVGDCSCPARETQDVCKHMVALATLVEAAAEADLAEARDRLHRSRQALLDFDKATLADWLLTVALTDPDRVGALATLLPDLD